MQYSNINSFNKGKQRGAILLFMVLIMMVVLISSSIHLTNRMVFGTKLSGADRDNAEAFLYAESTMELIRGRYINNLDTQPVVVAASCDLGGGISADSCEAGSLQANIATPNTELMAYMYYVTAGVGLDQTTPSLLQRVANGESGMNAQVAIANQTIPVATPTVRIEDMFDSGTPFLFSTNLNGTLIDDATGSWTALTTDVKTIAWMEVTLNPTNNQSIDLYVQAVAQVGNSKRYLQRYLGTYNPSNTLGSGLAGIVEASNLDRR